MTYRKLIAFFMLVALAGPLALRASAQGDKQGTDYAALTEQIEIMRRVWTRALSDRFADLLKQDAKADGKEGDSDGGAIGQTTAPEGESAVAPVPSGDDEDPMTFALESRVAAVARAQGRYWSGMDYSATSDTRGLYLPGHGVVYSTDVQIPLKVVPADQVESKTRDRDAWEEASQDVHGIGSGSLVYSVATPSGVMGSNKAAVYELDQRYIDAAIDTVTTCIAKYGDRIEQLPASESITVVIQLNGRGHGVYTFSTFNNLLRGNVVGTDGDVGRLVIEVPHSALGKDLDAARLRSQCRITRY